MKILNILSSISLLLCTMQVTLATCHINENDQELKTTLFRIEIFQDHGEREVPKLVRSDEENQTKNALRQVEKRLRLNKKKSDYRRK